MGRSPCCSKEGLNRGAWTKTEDMILSEYIGVHGDGGWQKLPQKAGLNRCGKSCRLRWRNYLRPDIIRGNISSDEEELIIRMHRLLGNRWSLIAGRLPGRTDNEIKNYWKSHLKQHAQSEAKMHNPKSRRKSPPPLQNHVFRITPVKTTPNGSNGYGCSNIPSSELDLKFSNIKETTNSSWCHLLANDSSIEDDSNRMAFGMTDVNLVPTEARKSATLAHQQSPHSDHFTGLADILDEGLLHLDELLFPDCNIFPSPSNLFTDFGLEEFCTGPPTLGPETNQLQSLCFDKSNMQLFSSSTFAIDQETEDFYHNTQHVDWLLRSAM